MAPTEEAGKCAVLKAEMAKNKSPFSPNCKDDGSYAVQQCFSEWCWCTLSDGVKIPETMFKKDTTEVKPDCAKLNGERKRRKLPQHIINN